MGAIVAFGFMTGLISMLLALYIVPKNRPVAGIMLLVAIIGYAVAGWAHGRESGERSGLAEAFEAGKILECREHGELTTASKEGGWKTEANDYLIREKVILHLKNCRVAGE